MLNTLNELYPKLIYILLHVFALYAILVLHHQYLSYCVRTRHFVILVQLILHHQNLSYLRTNCFLERSIVHCWAWTHFIMKEARMSTYHWLISWHLQGWYLLLYWFEYLQSRAWHRRDAWYVLSLDYRARRPVKVLTFGRGAGLEITFQDSWFRIFIPWMRFRCKWLRIVGALRRLIFHKSACQPNNGVVTCLVAGHK